MDPIRAAVERPLAVMALVVMAVLFGLLALARIPIQLAPDVERPVISVSTSWPGAAPAEVEREIVIRQEDALKGLEGVVEMSARARRGSARITLDFALGTDLDAAAFAIAERLDRVTGYPDEARSPVLDRAGNDDQPVAWFVMTRLPGNDRPIAEYGDFIEDAVVERLERAPGVASVDPRGGSAREAQVIVSPERLARYGLTIAELARALRGADVAVSAGALDEGKRRYTVRAEAGLDSVAAIEALVLRASGGGSRVTLGDVAEVRLGYKERGARARFRGEDSLSMSVSRETGANVITLMENLRAAVAELQDGALARAGLSIQQVYDETVYIGAAIDLVTQNIWVGGALAACVLMLFLRSWRATLIVSVAIPVSVVASFVAMAALGRTLNVISLAGIAFAIGMVVDAAIVVLENIWRMRENGLPAREAAWKGARQVWGAILVSALTTVLVFAPILVMEAVVGQLFRDIAVAISVAVLLSLVVAVTVAPALTARLLRGQDDPHEPHALPVIDRFGATFAGAMRRYAAFTTGHLGLGALAVAAISGGALLLSWGALPALDYLPQGARNFVFGSIIAPPGYNLDATDAIARRMEDVARPLWERDQSGPDDPPALDAFTVVAFPGGGFMAASAQEPERIQELIPILSRPVFDEPGAMAFMRQPSLFGRGVGGGRSISLEVSGPTLGPVLDAARRAEALAQAAMPPETGARIRARPGLELSAPELRVIPDRGRLADLGLTAGDLATALDVFNDGMRVGEPTINGRRIDLTLTGRAPGATGLRTQDVAAFPVAAPGGDILPLGDLARLELTAGPSELRRLERRLSISLSITPPDAQPLGAAMAQITDAVVAPLRAEGLPEGVRLTLAGAADALTQSWTELRLDLGFALAIVFLVMAILFESFLLPLVVMTSVPVAAAGGVAGLWLLNRFQPQNLDMLTLLGFVILIGVVVNNAILIVHQTLNHMREDGLAPRAAVLEATQNRIRPIFMSSLTSVAGMLPLVLFPGAGSELYRGLGSVVVGGLALSALLTLLTVPPLLLLALKAAPRAG